MCRRCTKPFLHPEHIIMTNDKKYNVNERRLYNKKKNKKKTKNTAAAVKVPMLVIKNVHINNLI
jgi:hypothetical protein